MCLYRRYSPGKPVLTPEQSFQLPPSLQESCSPFAFSVTGTLQVAHRLDRDAGELRQNPTISLEVLVKDRPSGGQENRMQITFIVEDINDNPAACTKTTFRYIHVPGAPPPPPCSVGLHSSASLAGTEESRAAGTCLNNRNPPELSDFRDRFSFLDPFLFPVFIFFLFPCFPFVLLHSGKK